MLNWQAADEPRQWEELCVVRVLGGRNTVVDGRVGGQSDSYAEFYREWLACRRFYVGGNAAYAADDRRWAVRPSMVPIVIDRDADSVALKATLHSLAAQLYAPQAMVVLSKRSAMPTITCLQLPLEADWSQQLNGCDAATGRRALVLSVARRRHVA